jgi:hypothetical protein
MHASTKKSVLRQLLTWIVIAVIAIAGSLALELDPGANVFSGTLAKSTQSQSGGQDRGDEHAKGDKGDDKGDKDHCDKNKTKDDDHCVPENPSDDDHGQHGQHGDK